MPAYPGRFGLYDQRGNNRVPGAPIPIRTAGGGRQQFLKISEITYVDAFDPSSNFYGADAKCDLNDDVSIYRRAVIKFPQSITLKAPYFLMANMRGIASVRTWDYTNANNMNFTFLIDIVPILSWGARTIADLTYDNFGDLTLGTNLRTGWSVASVFVNGDTSALGIYMGEADAGTDSSNNETQNFGGIDMTAGEGQTISGLVFYPGLTYNNLFRGATPAAGSLKIAKPTPATSSTIDMCFFTNK